MPPAIPSAAGTLLPSWEASADVVVVGTGVAGLTAAVNSAAAGLSVLLITKGRPEEASTQWAQGGVAVVRDERDPGDSVATHIEDTLVAGAGLADPIAVELILTEGPAAVQRLIEHGALFDAAPTACCAPARVGIPRTGSSTPAATPPVRRSSARCSRSAGCRRCWPGTRHSTWCWTAPAGPAGSRCSDRTVGVGLIRSAAVVLATGGAGHLYAATTNPGVATGDGLAMALRAGAALADTEFMQFHPTVLWTGPGDLGHRPLVTEAVRGEGAVLVDGAGARIMLGAHPLADLAPRDVVSLAVSRRMALAPGGISDHVFLDATGIAPDVFARRFPTVSAACALAGVNPTTDPIPVAPGRALPLRRRADRPGRTHHGPRAVRDRRGLPDRAARGESAGVELAAGGPGDG